MAVKELVAGLHVITLGPVNAYLIDEGDKGLTLIDSGYPKSAAAIEAGIRSMGREPSDLTAIVLTHAHPDHLGSAAKLAGGKPLISIHPSDAAIARAGRISQTMAPGPGFLNGLLFRLVLAGKVVEFPAFEPGADLADGDLLDVAGGIEVIHTPGHSAGHVSLLWGRDRGILFAGDAASNLLGLGYSLGYDDFETGKASLAKLARRDFEIAVFGHGRPLTSSASARFNQKWGRH